LIVLDADKCEMPPCATTRATMPLFDKPIDERKGKRWVLLARGIAL
jgi:hypothetical protein